MVCALLITNWFSKTHAKVENVIIRMDLQINFSEMMHQFQKVSAIIF